MDATTALAIYRAEKDKALRERRVSHVQLMAEAQEAFRKMLADAQLARKGGRPKGSTNAVAATPAAPPAPPAAPGKLVLKTTKPSPSKGVEKVTATAAAPEKANKTAKEPTARTSARPASKRAPEKKAVTAKAAPAPKAARRAAAPAARKGSAKKPKAPKRQAASREHKAKGRKR